MLLTTEPSGRLNAKKQISPTEKEEPGIALTVISPAARVNEPDSNAFKTPDEDVITTKG